MQALTLTAWTDILESVRARWFPLYTAVVLPDRPALRIRVGRAPSRP